MKDSIKRLLCGLTLVALAFGTLSAQADDEEVEDVIVVTGVYDPLWLYGFGIFVGGALGRGRAANSQTKANRTTPSASAWYRLDQGRLAGEV